MTNTTNAIPNSAISIRVMTPTMYLPALDPYALSGSRMMVAAKGPEPRLGPRPGRLSTALALTEAAYVEAKRQRSL